MQLAPQAGGQFQSGVMYVGFIFTFPLYLCKCVHAFLFYLAQCEPFCPNGTRSRKVWCETVPEGIVIPEAFCDCDLKPNEVEGCTNVPDLPSCRNLIPLWKTGNFSRVSIISVRHQLSPYLLDAPVYIETLMIILKSSMRFLYSQQFFLHYSVLR